MEILMENHWGYFLLNESNKSKHQKKSIAFKKHNYVNRGEVDRYLFSHFYDNDIFWWGKTLNLKLQELEETPDLCIADPESVWLDTGYNLDNKGTLQLHPWKS